MIEYIAPPKNTDYNEYRGKCKEYASALADKNPNLRLVRGFYDCPVWGEQQHWWCENAEGDVFDPTSKQFPSKGFGLYKAEST